MTDPDREDLIKFGRAWLANWVKWLLTDLSYKPPEAQHWVLQERLEAMPEAFESAMTPDEESDEP